MAITLKPEVLEKWPPGGWQFVQVLPNNLGTWEIKNPKSQTFRQTVGEIVTWRKANPVISVKQKLSVDWDVVSAELVAQTVARLQRMPKGDFYLTDDSPPGAAVSSPPSQKKTFWEQLKGAAAAVVDGDTIFHEWLGDGLVPVDPALSEHRAWVCVDCPQNTKRHWSSFFTAPVAAGIAKTVEMKNNVKLSTTHDQELGVCKACKCVLQLKVHVPLRHILAHTDEDTKSKLDPRCWILHEQ